MQSDLDLKKLAGMIRSKRAGKGLRNIAKEIGDITAPTLSRIERGNLPDVDTFMKLCKWLEVSPDFFTNKKITSKKDSTPHIIAAHLRADKNLPKKVTEALITMLNQAYSNVQKSTKKSNVEGKS